jgi:nucleoside-diphosphate-sugar epimerase
MNIFVTGGNGFVGRSLCSELSSLGNTVHASFRSHHTYLFRDVERIHPYIVGDISDESSWNIDFTNIDCVIHCAARAHVLGMSTTESLSIFRKINVEYTRFLVQKAISAGVRRFIYVSSIGVNGVYTNNSSFFRHDDKPAPIESYAVSKHEAENLLRYASEGSNLEYVIVRPPLIYGPGAKGNFARLLRLVESGIPLPFGAIDNKRSFVGLTNLIDLLILCTVHPNAAGQTLLLSDYEDLSTSDLLESIARSMGLRPHIVSVPLPLLRLLGYVIGKRRDVERLLGSLRVDDSYTRNLLNWSPVVSVEFEIKRMVDFYLGRI